ncbi:DUF4105 domain-containing protein [Candidatus Peregrinibacteria bacterium]|jgi:hypothetical protein|nr:DUF4105 domain-containing protein [Candidatus Peregrinibacteria bacterium]MBT7737033.1 DUF4105 domain-containing protein [Candidatus Peregrinibacteria bacterium]
MSKKKKTIIGVLIAIILLPSVYLLLKSPSNHRDWALDQQRLPYAEINSSEITVYQIRNFNYRSETDYDIDYYDKTFDLDKIKSVDYLVEPFEDWRGPAHTLLTFGFEDDEYIAISVEIRKEKGESFSPWQGLVREYELMYVIADEKDVIKLRTNFRKDDTYLYPIKASKEKIQKLFLDMIIRANELKDNPEFYNTITSTCTTNIVDHVNKITDNPIGFSYKILLPGFSDEIALENGLIDTDLSLEQAREKYQINELAEQHADAPDFSIKIRSGR